MNPSRSLNWKILLKQEEAVALKRVKEIRQSKIKKSKTTVYLKYYDFWWGLHPDRCSEVNLSNTSSNHLCEQVDGKLQEQRSPSIQHFDLIKMNRSE